MSRFLRDTNEQKIFVMVLSCQFFSLPLQKKLSMRLIAAFLVIITLLMCLAPAFEPDNCMCASNHHNCLCDSCEDDDDCNCCSPFISCKTCTGFILTKAISVECLVLHSIRHIAISQPHLIKSFISIPAQPPNHI